MCVHAKSLSCVPVSATPWTITCQAPLSMGFSRQEDWNGLPFPPPGDLPDPGMDPTSPALNESGFTYQHNTKKKKKKCHVGPVFWYLTLFWISEELDFHECDVSVVCTLVIFFHGKEPQFYQHFHVLSSARTPLLVNLGAAYTLCMNKRVKRI